MCTCRELPLVMIILMNTTNNNNKKKQTIRITREMVDAGKRVLTISDTFGISQELSTIVLTQDLSLLESKMPSNSTTTPKSFPSDAENSVLLPPEPANKSVHGLIKVHIHNVHNCTILVKCKLISRVVEINHCSNIRFKVEQEACVATLQMDLCSSVKVEFHDAPSGKHTTGVPSRHSKVYWGEDPNDRIFTAGVSDLHLQLYRNGIVDMETTLDYIKDGAVAVGNATPEEFQFVTSVVGEELVTEKVVRQSSVSTHARAMTQREMQQEEERRNKAVDLLMEKAIRFEETGQAQKEDSTPQQQHQEEEHVVEEVYTSMTKTEIKEIVSECEGIKVRGNQAFAAGEYAQAVLFYSLALDKADELPDKNISSSTPPLFARHVILANRSAAFLKLGEHEKALADASSAHEMEPTFVKAVFRKGLALHAMGRYLEAIQVLAQAHKLEPYNQQIKQALQFSERRLQQEMAKR
mmetsp:Transcript_2428/g.4442  ORF Transcript_2428/g.4442 Transcript_2428/m.4442 type:complete len:467 (-) Transcript_2428:50-1450(-)